MLKDPMERLHLRERAEELRRLRELEAKDVEVESEHGPRPLEGFAGGHTTWASMQDDEAAREEYGRDADGPEAPAQQAVSAEAEEEAIL